MGSTNKTPELALSQFVATDKPTWLGDYNSDMRKIETSFGGIKTVGDEAKVAADEAKASAASAASQAQQAVSAAVNTLTGEIERAQATATTTAKSYTDSQIGTVPDTARRIALEVVNQSTAGGPLTAFQTLLRTRGASARVVGVGGDSLKESLSGEAYADWFSRLAFRSGAARVEQVGSAAVTSGMQWINAGISGATSANYVPNDLAAQVGNLAPSVIIHHVGASDFVTNVDPALYENRIRAAVLALESAAPGAVNVLVMPARREDVTGTWPYDQYNAALKRVVGEAPEKRIHIDLSYSLSARGGFWGVMDTNKINLTREGHILVADIIGGYLGIPSETGLQPNMKSYDLETAGTKNISPGAGVTLISRVLEAVPYPRLVKVDGVINYKRNTAQSRLTTGVYAANPDGSLNGNLSNGSNSVHNLVELQSTPQNVYINKSVVIPPNERAVVVVQALSALGASAASTIEIQGGNRTTALYSVVEITAQPY